MLRVGHYINQFFAQLGGEEAASVGLSVHEKPLGPGLIISRQADIEAEVAVTVVCGDNYIAEHLETAADEIAAIFERYQVDVVLAGPAYAAGRYGVGCGAVCRAVQERLGIPAVTAMNEENPGVNLYRKSLYILRAGKNARTVSRDISAMLALADQLRAGLPGIPEGQNYFPRGLVQNVPSPYTSSARAVNMLLDKIAGREFTTEVPLSKQEKVPPAPAVADLSQSTVVMVTDGGLYPMGNPDHMPPANPDRFERYPVGGMDALPRGAYEVSHNGYDHAYVAEDPNRLVPLDGMRALERRHVIGKLHDFYLSTTGLTTTIVNSKKIAAGMIAYIRNHGIDAAILTST